MSFKNKNIMVISGSYCIDNTEINAILEDLECDTNILPIGQMNTKWIANNGCVHEWTEYHGLIESFFYCKKCDKKKPHEN